MRDDERMRIELPHRKLFLDAEWYGESGPVLVLIMGLGMQRLAWPPQLIEQLVASGLRVLTFDNRDIGLSGRFDHLPANIPRAALRYALRLPVRAAYTLDDMADDTLALLDALGVESCHVAGASMGGMIAQQMCLRAPRRVRSHVSIMSSAGPRAAPFPSMKVLRKMLSAPPANAAHDRVVEHYVQLFTVLGVHKDQREIDWLRQRLDASIRRAYRPRGTARQLLAVCADDDRRAPLRALTTPTLILHGTVDPLVPPPAATVLQSCIPGATLRWIEGMGHDLPLWALAEIAARIMEHVQRHDQNSLSTRST